MARFQLNISEDGLAEIDRLMELTKTQTKKEFVNNSITLMKWAIKQCKQGHIIASVNEEKGIFRELEMPILDRARLAYIEDDNEGKVVGIKTKNGGST